jgi:hypothetical protein
VRLFFAHQSVGQNLLDGVAALSGGEKQRLGVVPLLGLDRDQAVAAWVDLPVGKNGDPKGKVDAFVAAFAQHPKLEPQLALLKFCYVDFQPATDVDELFRYYERALRELEIRYPATVFGHVTVPLTLHPTELKWRLFRLLGRSVWEDEANVKRQAFNRRLQAAFSSDRIFDLAGAEALGPDGRVERFEHEGQPYYALDPRYAEDEGHLNSLGQRVLGTAFIRFVAGTPVAVPKAH